MVANGLRERIKYKKKSGILKLCLKKDIEKNKVSILSVNCLTIDIDWTRVSYVY